MSLSDHSCCLQSPDPCRCTSWLAELQSPVLTGIGSVLCRIQGPGGGETWLQLTDISPPPLPEQRGRPGLGGSGPKEFRKPFSWVSPFPEPGSLLPLPACLWPPGGTSFSQHLRPHWLSPMLGSYSVNNKPPNHDHCGRKDKNKCSLML